MPVGDDETRAADYRASLAARCSFLDALEAGFVPSAVRYLTLLANWRPLTREDDSDVTTEECEDNRRIIANS